MLLKIETLADKRPHSVCILDDSEKIYAQHISRIDGNYFASFKIARPSKPKLNPLPVPSSKNYTKRHIAQGIQSYRADH
jgi:hypothetical protein